MKEEILEFYRKTSLYTDLGLYRDFAINLPDDIMQLCILNRNQLIHPFDLKDKEERKNKNSFYGDMTKIPETTLIFENDLFPTAIAILSELLRRDPNYSVDRDILDKVHVCCRETSILLISILKAKGIPARCRSGFTHYISEIDGAGDHWIVEFYDKEEKRWKLVDPTMCYSEEILKEYGIDFNLVDMPKEKFIFGAQAYLGIRNGKYKSKDIYCFSNPYTYGIEASINALFYDFHCLMNDEIIFLQHPKYLRDKDFKLTEEEYKELDNLATLMLEPNDNFDKLLTLWNNNPKFRIMSGGMNG